MPDDADNTPANVGGDSQVRGRVAVITGASRGIGAGLAERLAARGVHVGLCARSEPPMPVPVASPLGVSAAADEARHALTASVDVTDAAAVERFCDEVADRLGPIELWVNNAGLLAPIGPLRDADPAELTANIEVNVVGVLNGSRAYARHVRSRPGRGVLVNMSSGAATKPYEGWAAYCASKAAVDHLTRVVALEEADAGLRAHAVAPGIVDTDMQALIRSTPQDRFPEAPRFRELKRAEAFNSLGWVADHILALAFGADEAAPTVVRLPDEPLR